MNDDLGKTDKGLVPVSPKHATGKTVAPLSSKAMNPPANNGTNEFTDVSQKLNQVGGNLSGRDNINVENLIVNLPPVAKESHLAKLYRLLEKEAECNKNLRNFIEQLEIYTRPVANEEVIGIEGKLTAADRQNEITMAEAMKEAIFAQIRARMFSPTYQIIAAILMGKIFERFKANIRPLVVTNSSNEEIDKAVATYVIEPLAAELEACEFFADSAEYMIRSMLYFLTGNCHINWH